MSERNIPYDFDSHDPSPNWSEGGRVHNWRNHVGHYTRKIWRSLSPEQRAAIALDAEEDAGAEEWD